MHDPVIDSAAPAAATRPLHNEDWGFDSNCFVCEPRNSGGLQIPFAHDASNDTVVASFTLGPRFSGAPSYVHGGITLAVLDEAMAWATIAVGGKFAVTVNTSTRFLRPVLVGKEHVVEARLCAQNEECIETAAVIRDPDGKVCAETTASFAVLGAAQAVKATGADASVLDPTYLK